MVCCSLICVLGYFFILSVIFILFFVFLVYFVIIGVGFVWDLFCLCGGNFLLVFFLVYMWFVYIRGGFG